MQARSLDSKAYSIGTGERSGGWKSNILCYNIYYSRRHSQICRSPVEEECKVGQPILSPRMALASLLRTYQSSDKKKKNSHCTITLAGSRDIVSCFTNINTTYMHKQSHTSVLGVANAVLVDLEHRLRFWQAGRVVDLADALFSLALSQRKPRCARVSHNIAWKAISAQEIQHTQKITMVPPTGFLASAVNIASGVATT